MYLNLNKTRPLKKKSTMRPINTMRKDGTKVKFID
jgi:hypothetical protein